MASVICPYEDCRAALHLGAEQEAEILSAKDGIGQKLQSCGHCDKEIFLFCHQGRVAASKKVSSTGEPDKKKVAYYIVWNEAKTEGFVTTDEGLAYETRKCATTNLYDENGVFSPLAAAFCEKWGDGNCTTERVSIPQS